MSSPAALGGINSSAPSPPREAHATSYTPAGERGEGRKPKEKRSDRGETSSDGTGRSATRTSLLFPHHPVSPADMTAELPYPSRLCSGLIILATLQLSSCSIYVWTGSDITDCSMKCPHGDGVLQLYRECGGDETQLLELWCDNMWHYNRYQPRLLYNTSSECWTLTDAGKSDSCVYKVVYYGEVGRFLTTLHITVLDPVLISTITSNGSRTGEDIAVSVQFSGEETAVTWEVDGGLLPDRYRLMDDNRTVIIPRDDAGRKLRVRITNPVSEETQEYQLGGTTDPAVSVYVPVGIVCSVAATASIALLVMLYHHRRTKANDGEKH